jgi:hypothetical protein
VSDWWDDFERRATRGVGRGADAVFDAASMDDYGASDDGRRRRRTPLLVAAGVVAIATVGGVALVAVDDDGAEPVTATPPPTTCTVFVRPEATAERFDEISALVVADPDIDSVEVLTQQDAYVEFVRLFADKPELVESVTPEVLPPSVRGLLVDPTDARKVAFEARYDGMPGVRDTICYPGLPSDSPPTAPPYDCWVTPVPGTSDEDQQPIRDAIESVPSAVSYTYGDPALGPHPTYAVDLIDAGDPAKQAFIERLVVVPHVASVGCGNDS